MSVKRTVAKNISYLGAAIWEGQLKRGVDRGPQLLREAGLFDFLKQRHKVNVRDFGDVRSTEEELKHHESVEHPARNLNILGPVLGKLHNKVHEIMTDKDN